MPPDRLLPPRNFAGRVSELDLLASNLLASPAADATGQVFLHGPTGVGKTALAAEFAHRHMADFRGVHYLPSLTELDTPEDAARAAEITADHFEPQSRALIVVEDVSDADPIGTSVFVQTLRDMRSRARFILTSRMALVMPNRWLDIALGGLPDAEMTALLGEQDLGAADIHALLSRAGGNPLLAMTIADLARRGEGLEQLLARLDPATYPGILGPDGRPLGPEGQPPEPVEVALRAMSAELLESIKQDPNRVHALSSRGFEEFVAALYEKHGFEVELTPASRDGGFDLYAVRYEPFGKVVTIVECKRNAPHRPVGVELVRSLYGAVEDKGASVGVLATTSSFTSGAKALQERHGFRLALQDWFDLQDMLG
jgi:restriction system protein